MNIVVKISFSKLNSDNNIKKTRLCQKPRDFSSVFLFSKKNIKWMAWEGESVEQTPSKSVFVPENERRMLTYWEFIATLIPWKDFPIIKTKFFTQY